MRCRWLPTLTLVTFLTGLTVDAQEPPPDTPPPGIEVQARGPVHEAFASPTSDPVPTRLVPRKPPAPVEELPPDQKPEGDAVWISGYWAYDDDTRDFLWVSGVWRKPPVGKTWVAGYWREEGTSSQWVPGFWAVSKADDRQDLTYLPSPPEAPAVATPRAPSADAFFVPGCWVWRGSAYAWRAGYWARVQPGYVWIADHYRWTPTGYVFVDGYWDLALPRRGILYAPVVISPSVIRAGFVYTPTYAVNDSVIVSAMFVRPSVTHYYFGDYYGPAYADLGYESCVVYSRRRYEPVIVYETYRQRDPAWLSIQLNLYNDRCAGRSPRPPRTLVQQNTFVRNNVTNVTVVNNVTMIAPPAQVAARKETKLVALDTTSRQTARAQALTARSVAAQRSVAEVRTPPGSPRVARSASLNVGKSHPSTPVPSATTARPTAGARLGSPMPKTPGIPGGGPLPAAGKAPTAVGTKAMPTSPAVASGPPRAKTPPAGAPGPAPSKANPTAGPRPVQPGGAPSGMGRAVPVKGARKPPPRRPPAKGNEPR